MGVGVHAFVQYPYDFNTLGSRLPKENNVAALGKLPVALSNRIDPCSHLRILGETGISLEQLSYIEVTLWPPPPFQGMNGNLPHIRVSRDRKPESSQPG